MQNRIEPANFWENLPFSIFSSSFYNKAKYMPHTHRYYEFFLVVEGELIQNKNAVVAYLSKRSLCFLNPEDRHELRNSQKSDHVQIINCTFSEEFFHEAVDILKMDFKKTPANWSKTLVNIPSQIWQGLIHKANSLQFEKNTFSPDAQQSYFRSLLYDVMFLLAKPEKSMNYAIPAWLVKAREQMEMEEHFISGLEQFIKLSGKTQEHLNRSIRKHYKETPTAFINQLRCKKAAQLLLYSQKDTWTIMFECGFRNYSYFLKCFRKSFSMSPKQYIKINRKVFALN
jgi:AraC family transcriptional regulator, dual regulator of chb operon